MKCMKQISKTYEDILRLQEMIGLKELNIKNIEMLDEIRTKGYIERKIEEYTEEYVEEYMEKSVKSYVKEYLKEYDKGKEIGKLEVINGLLDDPKNTYTAEELSEKFGINIEQIQNKR